eukprot:GDKJ01001816.1.p1 GENE.GDKJ01001816.1~~GDKJ01001816.1.p1  ORF type:complete len:697 (+),score=165.13 GDKJ01001816.1:2-2092(+)
MRNKMRSGRVFSRFGGAFSRLISSSTIDKTFHFNEKITIGVFVVTGAVAAMLNNRTSDVAYAEKPNFIPVATRNSIEEGKIYEYIVNDGVDRVAVTFVNGKYYCVSGFCPHFKAQLAAGVVDKATISCPWHGCRYCLKTGRRLEGPSHHDIETFDVVVDEEGTVFVSVPKGSTVTRKVTNVPSKVVDKDKTTLIIGSGASGFAAADALREYGFGGRVMIVGEEPYLPYDRTLLSKNPNCRVERLSLRSKEEFDKRKIELKTGEKVVEVIGKEAILASGEKVKFDNLLVATGRNAPSKIHVDNEDAANVVHFKSFDDVTKVKSFIFPYCKVVIVGQDSVACELGSALRRLECQVTMVTNQAGPLCDEGGIRVRDSVAAILRGAGVNFVYGSNVKKFILSEHIKAQKIANLVQLASGDVLQADLIIVCGRGETPGLKVDGKVIGEGGWEVDDRLRSVERPDIHAVGDCCRMPSQLMEFAFKGEKNSQQKRLFAPHAWTTAIDTGRAAARDIIGLETLREMGELEKTQMTEAEKKKLTKISTSHIPLYSTFVEGKSYRFTGLDGSDIEERIHPVDLKVQQRPKLGVHGLPTPFCLVEGDIKSKFRFTGWVFRAGSDRVLGTVSGGVDPAPVGIRELLLKDAMPEVGSLLMGVFNARAGLHMLTKAACFGGNLDELKNFSSVLPTKQELETLFQQSDEKK